MRKIYRVKEERNIIHTVKRRKANWIGHIWCRNRLLKHVFEGKRDGICAQGRRRKQLLEDIKETRRYWKFKEEELDRTLSEDGF